MGVWRTAAWTATLMLACIAVMALPASAARNGAYPGGNGVIAFVEDSSGGGWVLSAMNPDGSAPRVLVPASVSGSVADLAWSPDGRRLAFRDDRFRLSVVNSDGTGHRVIADNAWGGRPSWSPSGEEIAASILTDGTRTLMAIRADGSSSRVLVPHNRVASFEDFAWSSTGKIAMRRRYGSGHPDAGKQALVTMNDGGGNETVIFRPVHQAPGPESLSWSPDGTQIAFRLDEYLDNGRLETRINVLNADGSNRRILGIGRDPAWSPDGTKIVYTTGGLQSMARVTVMNADGSEIKDLGRQGWNPDWQPCPAGATCRFTVPPARCRVPRVVGLLLGSARVRVRRANCSVGRIRRARSRRVGRVVTQSPRPGAVKPRGFPVRLLVGRR